MEKRNIQFLSLYIGLPKTLAICQSKMPQQNKNCVGGGEILVRLRDEYLERDMLAIIPYNFD
jgi:hypothetical protein